MLFDNLNHLNEIFILLSLLEQSTLVLRNSLLFLKPAPQEEDPPRVRPGTPPAEASRGAVGAFLQTGGDWGTGLGLLPGKPGAPGDGAGAEYLSGEPGTRPPLPGMERPPAPPWR